MAIDTAAKRASSIGVGMPFILSIIPDGTIDAADRQTVSDSYGGIEADPPPPAGIGGVNDRIDIDIGIEI